MCDLKQLRSLFGAGSCFCGLAPLLLTVPAAARLSSALAQASPRSFTPPGFLSTGLSWGLAPPGLLSTGLSPGPRSAGSPQHWRRPLPGASLCWVSSALAQASPRGLAPPGLLSTGLSPGPRSAGSPQHWCRPVRGLAPPGLLSTGLSRGLAPQAGCITTLWASAQCTRPVSRRPLQGPSPRLRGSSTRPHTPLA